MSSPPLRRLVEISGFRRAAGPSFDQYWSELRITPSFFATIASQTWHCDRVLDEVNAAVTEANVHAPRVHAPALATAVIHATAAVETHSLLGRIEHLLSQNRAGLHLVTAVVAALKQY